MPENVLTSLNWLDLLMIIVIIAMVYRGAINGFVVEIFKVFGAGFATVISLHFYVRAAEFLQHFIALPLALGEIASFIIITIFIILLFRLVGQGWLLILKVEAKAGFSQWGGGLVAFFTSLLICSLLFFGMLQFGNSTLNKFVKHSISGHYLYDLSPNVYKATYEKLIVPFFPDEPFNQKAFENVEK